MTEEEYKAGVSTLQHEYDFKRSQLDEAFAKSNNPYKVGDIVEDQIGFCKITSMYVEQYRTEFPSMVYRCQNLTRRMTVNNREPERLCWQTNVKKLIATEQ